MRGGDLGFQKAPTPRTVSHSESLEEEKFTDSFWNSPHSLGIPEGKRLWENSVIKRKTSGAALSASHQRTHLIPTPTR